MSAGDWYYGIGGAQHGPVSFPQLQQMARTGQLGPTALVWAEGMPNWIPAGRLPALFPTGDDAALGLLVPVGPHSGLAVAAGYCGLLGILLPLAPLGILLGILALADLKKKPGTKGFGRAITGIVAGSIWMLLYLVMIIASRR